MVIRQSSAREVAALLRDLEQGTDAARQAAAARLAVIGTRAVEGLLAVLARTSAREARVAALSALEAIGDARALNPAFELFERGDAEVWAAASSLLVTFLDGKQGTEVLDRLTAVALDAGRPDASRVAALTALAGLPRAVTSPLWARLKTDSSEAVRNAVSAPADPSAGFEPAAELQSAAEGNLPAAPEDLRRWLNVAGSTVPLPTLHRLIETLRSHEAVCERTLRARWATARAAAHLALAERGSTVALYDLRETIERGEPGPVEMLAALERIGDRSCLEPIAAACARLAGTGRGAEANDPAGWWREHLAGAFQAIARREGVGGRQAEARRIRSRWPHVAATLLGPTAKR